MSLKIVIRRKFWTQARMGLPQISKVRPTVSLLRKGVALYLSSYNSSNILMCVQFQWICYGDVLLPLRFSLKLFWPTPSKCTCWFSLFHQPQLAGAVSTRTIAALLHPRFAPPSSISISPGEPSSYRSPCSSLAFKSQGSITFSDWSLNSQSDIHVLFPASTQAGASPHMPC